tara:strand:+ start:130 stop:330 length:201 start_codon:yes stop_codon:yes gene_type:complete
MEVVTDHNRKDYEYNFDVFLINSIRGREDILNMTVEQLKQFCRDNGIRGYSGKMKADLQKHVLDSF